MCLAVSSVRKKNRRKLNSEKVAVIIHQNEMLNYTSKEESKWSKQYSITDSIKNRESQGGEKKDWKLKDKQSKSYRN